VFSETQGRGGISAHCVGSDSSTANGAGNPVFSQGLKVGIVCPCANAGSAVATNIAVIMASTANTEMLRLITHLLSLLRHEGVATLAMTMTRKEATSKTHTDFFGLF
jgi:hypothetical protein